MIDERQEELASLYALDLLEGAERAEFERAVAQDRALQTLVRELRETSATLAHTTVTASAPAQLKSRVLASIDNAEEQPDNVIRPAVFGFRQFLPWAIAACFAFVAAWCGRLYVASETEAARLRQLTSLAEIELKSTRQKLEATELLASQQLKDLNLANFKIAALASIAKNTPEALAVAVWNPTRQEGVLALEKMPVLQPDQRFELWVVEDKADAKPVSAGVFDLRNATLRMPFKASTTVGAIKTFAISREKDDGVRFHAEPTEVLFAGDSR
jgi:anti-sigma-K factor RskA